MKIFPNGLKNADNKNNNNRKKKEMTFITFSQNRERKTTCGWHGAPGGSLFFKHQINVY